MLHYTIQEDEKSVKVYGIVHTSLDPEQNWASNKN